MAKTKHSKNFTKYKRYYANLHVYTKQMLQKLVEVDELTAAEYEEITGEVYTEDAE